MLKPWVDHDKRTGKYAVRWRDSNGKIQRDKGYAWDTRPEAKRRMKVLVIQNSNNALGYYKEITLSEAFVIFKRHILPKLANDAQRYRCGVYVKQITDSLGHLPIDKITYTHIVDYWTGFLDRGCKASTANRSIMWICNLYERFRMWNAMVPEMMPEKVALPETNPVQVAKEYLGRKTSELPFRRQRVLSRAELKQAKEWCLKNSPEFWNAIKMAILTALRKSDLLALKAGDKIEGIQGKTMQPFELPLILEKPISARSLRTQWDALRKDLGWYEEGTPLHITWHDLRHCGPTMIGEMGYSSKIIQSILGHATEQQSLVYTNVRGKTLAPAIDALRRELNAI